MPSKAFGFLRMLVGAIFVVSGFMKLMQPYQNFLLAVHGYQILSGMNAEIFAKTMPWVEFLIGVFLVLGLWSKLSLLVLWALNTLFIGVVGSAMIRRLPIHDCGCFGESFSLPLYQILLLDLALWFVFMCLAGFFDATRSFSFDKKFDNK